MTLTCLHQTHLCPSPARLSSCLLTPVLCPSEKLFYGLWGYSHMAFAPAQFLPFHLPAPFLPNPSHPFPGLGLGIGLYLSFHASPPHPPNLAPSPHIGHPWEAHKHSVSLKSWSKINSANLMGSTVVSWRSVSGLDLQIPIPFLCWGWNQQQDRNDSCEEKGLNKSI